MLEFVLPIYTWLVYAPLFLCWTALNTVAVVLLTLVTPVYASRWVPRLWARLSYWLSLSRLSIRGLHHIDRSKSYIIVANHVSQFDIFLVYGWTPLDIKWVMKKEIRNVPLIGISCATMGHIFIDRSNRAAAVKTLEEFKHRLRPGESVMFFPEGTRSDGGNILEFKKGAFVMAKDLDLPILPVTILGTEHILPTNTVRLRPGKSTIVFHPPISLEHVRSLSATELAVKSRQIISEPMLPGVPA